MLFAGLCCHLLRIYLNNSINSLVLTGRRNGRSCQQVFSLAMECGENRVPVPGVKPENRPHGCGQSINSNT